MLVMSYSNHNENDTSNTSPYFHLNGQYCHFQVGRFNICPINSTPELVDSVFFN